MKRVDERKKRKKAANIAKHAAYKAQADRRRQKANTVEKGKFNHETQNCGNQGCKQCFASNGQSIK